MRRRPFLQLAAALGTAGPAAAQTVSWPARPVTILVAYVAGGPSDTLARTVAAALQPAIGQTVVVENRPGANGSIAAAAAARAAPDGHTVFVAASSILTINPHVMRGIAYDPMRDFAPLTLAISAPNVIVAHPSFVPSTVPELIAWLKANPNKASYGSSGIGSTEHLGMELFAQRTGTELTHVPYGGSAGAVTALVGGTLQLSFLNAGSVAPQIASGVLKPIAVGGLERHPLMPNVPTVAETVPGFTGGSWHGFVVPAATPAPVQERIRAALLAALRQPETQARLERTGFAVDATDGPAFAERIAREWAAWRDVVAKAGIGTG